MPTRERTTAVDVSHKNGCGQSSGKPVVLITGASSGFGQACARHLCHRGYRVYGTSRRASWPPDDRRSSSGNYAWQLMPMDVRDADSVRDAVESVLEETGRIDVAVCNAGVGLAGSVEDTTVAEAKNQFDTNFFGVWEVCRSVLPHMRQNGGGYLVIVGSLAGRMSIPFQAAYSASKFALEGLAEALRMEVKPWGVHVVLIEPGDFRTGFTGNRSKADASRHHPDYADAFNRALRVMEADERNGAGPEQVAFLLERIIKHPSPRLRYTIGPIHQRLGACLKRLIPGGWFEKIMMATYRLR